MQAKPCAISCSTRMKMTGYHLFQHGVETCAAACDRPPNNGAALVDRLSAQGSTDINRALLECRHGRWWAHLCDLSDRWFANRER
jgi:hypothetical protein